MEKEKTSEKKGCRDLVGKLAGIECGWDGWCDHSNIAWAVAWQGLALLHKLAPKMATWPLVWQCTDRLDCTYGQMGTVKHNAGTLGW